MSKRIFRIMAVISICTTLAVLTAYAQQNGRQLFDVPFEFTVKGKTLPAGKYYFQRFDNQNPHLMRISSLDRRTNIIFNTMSAPSKETSQVSELTFRKYGQRHFLSQISNLSGSFRYELPTSRAEKELKEQARADKGRDISAVTPNITETVTVSAMQ